MCHRHHNHQLHLSSIPILQFTNWSTTNFIRRPKYNLGNPRPNPRPNPNTPDPPQSPPNPLVRPTHQHHQEQLHGAPILIPIFTLTFALNPIPILTPVPKPVFPRPESLPLPPPRTGLEVVQLCLR
jgi:hypothetical protein